MEKKPTVEAVEARVRELIGGELGGESHRRHEKLIAIYDQLALEMRALRELWEAAHRESQQALLRSREPGWPSGYHSLAGIALNIEFARARVETLQETIALLETEAGASPTGS
jgi:hypothetical protein